MRFEYLMTDNRAEGSLGDVTVDCWNPLQKYLSRQVVYLCTSNPGTCSEKGRV